MTSELNDAEARERALDPRRSFLVEAPAGSGKTTLLTQRLLGLLAVVDEPEAILAITFTRKAAEEMRTRVIAALGAARDEDSTLNPRTRELAEAALAAGERRGWRLLGNARRLHIQTIDALSARLARRGPLASGLGNDAATLEDPGVVYAEAARETIAQIGYAGPWVRPVTELLRHLDNDWERFEQLLTAMLARRDQWLPALVPTLDRAALERTLERMVEAELAQAAAMIPVSLKDELARLSAYAGANIAADDAADPRACLAQLVAFPGTGADALENWRALTDLLLTGAAGQGPARTLRKTVNVRQGFPPHGESAKADKAAFVELLAALAAVPGLSARLNAVGALPDVRFSAWEWRTIGALIDVLKLAAAHLQLAFRRAGAHDFTEVSQAALKALGDPQAPTDLQLLLDYRIQHILIDEFQDTSASQCELLERLIDGWTADDGRSLFLVGDPMQSIYRFREADVGLFNDTRRAERMGAVPLEVLRLTTNFRSQARLIDWINDTIVTLGGGPDDPFADLPRLVAARAAEHVQPATVQVMLDGVSGKESSAVVELVQSELRDRPDWRIGILVRGRTHLDDITAALGEAGIAVSASAIDQLADLPVVQDLVGLTRALTHFADSTAWFALLRAPWCGLTLADLTRLRAGHETPIVWEWMCADDAPARVAADARENFSLLKSVCATALDDVGRVPLAVLVERTWRALDGPLLYPATMQRHAERYFELLDQIVREESIVTAASLATRLQKLHVAPPAAANTPVEIMTIHHAKGLEFDVVIVPGMARKPQRDDRRLLELRRHRDPSGAHLVVASIPRSGGRTRSVYEYLRAAEDREASAEAHRLLYVAMTRARERLHLVGTLQPGGDEPVKPPTRGSFLHMLWPAVSLSAVVRDAPVGGAAGTATTPAAGPSRTIRRLQRPPTSSRAAPAIEPAFPVREVEFSWASPIAKHVGTLTHELLQRISQDGLADWSATRIAELGPALEKRLREYGLGSADRATARERIIAALTATLASPRGRWILDGDHTDAASELAMTTTFDGYGVNAVIDRTFVDDTGVRWIVDFKTGAHTGGGIEAFIASEQERYRPQLERYARFMRATGEQRIRLGLYFPLLDEWVAWDYDPVGEDVPL